MSNNPPQQELMTTGKKYSEEYQLTVKRDEIMGIQNEFDALGMKKKRPFSKIIDTLFNALFEDLTVMYEWQSEEEKPMIDRMKKGNDLGGNAHAQKNLIYPKHIMNN